MPRLLIIFVIIIAVLGGLYLGFGRQFLQKPQPQKYSGPVEKITFSSSSDIKNGPIYIAQSKGYFQEEGLEVNIVEIPSAKKAFSNMLNKEVDIAAVAEVPIVFSSFDREDFYIVATISHALDDKIVARRDKNIQVVTDLKGKKVGISGKGTSTHFFLTTLLTYNNMFDSDVEITVIEPEKLISSLEEGRLDAAVFWEPFAAKAKQALQDKAVIFPNQGIYRKMYNLTVTKDFAKNHPETLKRFLKAIDKATGFISSNEQESQAIIAKQLNLNTKEISLLWDETSYALSLGQSLLLTLEDEARWAIKNKLTDKTNVPNYLNYIYFDALTKVKPEAVTIIH